MLTALELLLYYALPVLITLVLHSLFATLSPRPVFTCSKCCHIAHRDCTTLERDGNTIPLRSYCALRVLTALDERGASVVLSCSGVTGVLPQAVVQTSKNNKRGIYWDKHLAVQAYMYFWEKLNKIRFLVVAAGWDYDFTDVTFLSWMFSK
jgi:hypothetical protein